MYTKLQFFAVHRMQDNYITLLIRKYFVSTQLLSPNVAAWATAPFSSLANVPPRGTRRRAPWRICAVLSTPPPSAAWPHFFVPEGTVTDA
jgi:hypothetical protein